jgi:hypothetical protein
MGYSETEFLNMTPRFFANAIEAYELNQRERWEQMRMLAYFTVSPHFNPKKANPTPQKLWPFPWDETPMQKITPLSAEELKRIQALQLEKMNRAKLQRNGNNSGS